MLGSTEPRLWTPPLRPLTPITSYGYDVIDFARDILGTPLDPWQSWLVIHAGELLPDGRPRFRTVLVLVARQQGKTFLLQVLVLYWLFVEQQRMVLWTSTNRDYARVAWKQAVDRARAVPELADEIPPDGVRQANGSERLLTTDGCTYRIAANNGQGGRGLTLNRLILDELREHHTFDAWDAAVNAMNAVPDAQVYAITNQGDDESIVLDSLRTPGLSFIETGEGDRRLGLFEWSSPPGASPTDLHALAQAMPNLGRGGSHGTDPDAILGAAMRAQAAGGLELTGFRTEIMCQRVLQLDPAIDPERWAAAGTDTPIDLAEHRRAVALCFDISLDGSHASLVAAAVVDGKVHVEVVAAWEGFGCGKAVRAELPAIVERVRPRALGWFPSGPAAAVAVELQDRGVRGWPPRRVELAELRAENTAVCMGLAEQVRSDDLRHPRDPLLDAHVAAAQRLHRGDGWVFTRRGSSAIDAAYAMGGAVHLARSLKALPPPLTVL